MESPASGSGETATRVVTRGSVIDSIRGCGLSGMRIDKEELRRRLVMPQYLRFAMRDAIRLQDPTAGEARFHERTDLNVGPPEAPIVVFINARSGGRHGPELKERLLQLIAEEQVWEKCKVEFVCFCEAFCRTGCELFLNWGIFWKKKKCRFLI